MKRNKDQSSKIRVHNGKGLESKENEGASSQGSKGSWRRLTKESSTTMATDGCLEEDEEGPKRKIVVPLGEVNQNMA